MTALIIILLPLVGCVLPVVFARWSRGAAAIGAGIPAVTALGLLLSYASPVFAGETIVHTWPWIPEFGLNVAVRVDGLGFFFALLILAIGCLIVTYAHWYLSEDDPPGRFFGALLLFMGAMLGVVLSENILLLVVFWELTSISSFLLIGYWNHREVAREGARMALAVTGAGGLALIGGALLLGEIVGSYELTQILAAGEQIQNHELYLPALALVLLGAFTKSAQFPFHAWLPNAMTAPTPVSAYLHSATMVKAGIFLLARLHPAMAGTDAWVYAVSGVGLWTMAFAAYVAIKEHDLKGLLAYSTISHLGLITALLGFGTKHAAVAAIFHIFNHAAFKASLFMTAGIVDHEAGSRDMRELGGLRSAMPITFVLGLIGAAAMAGVPLFNGFISKEMFFTDAVAMVHHAPFGGGAAGWLVPIVATLGGVFSVAYSIRFVVDTFMGDAPDEYPGHPHDPSVGFWAPVAVLVGISVAVGIAPAAIAETLVSWGSAATYGLQSPEPLHVHLKLWHGFGWPLMMSGIAFGGGALVFALRHRIIALHESLPDLRGKAVFQELVEAFRATARTVSRLENGSLQRYVVLFVMTVVVAGASPLLMEGLHFQYDNLTGLTALSILGWVMLVVAAVASAALHRQRMRSLIAVGLVGLMVSLAFVLFSGPDLAMTQLSVEVVNVLLLLLALSALPEESPHETPWTYRLRDGIVAVLAGSLAAVMAFSVMTRPYTRISDYFLAESYPLGHGTNVVNVILVDFRAFDTMGEVTVLVIAALGIASMLTGRGPETEKPRPASRERSPLILSHVARPLMALVLAAAAFIFLRGHNQPGGGFIAGLVATVALVIQYIAHGFTWANERMQVNFRVLGVVGVGIAVVSGMAAWLFSAPFLSQGKWLVDIWGFGEVKLVSTLAFDLGVFLAVVGAVMAILLRLGEYNREDSPETFDPLASTDDSDPWKP